MRLAHEVKTFNDNDLVNEGHINVYCGRNMSMGFAMVNPRLVRKIKTDIYETYESLCVC